MNTKEWLAADPSDDEIRVKDGAKYIPYKIIVDKLYHLCGHNWGAPHFTESYVSVPRGRLLVSGNVIVEVTYEIDGKIVTRRLPGGANFILHKGSNPHPTGTVKSLAIMNAVKPLGKQFGWELNPENEDEKTDFTPVIKVDSPKEKDEYKIRLSKMIASCSTETELLTYKILSDTNGLKKEYSKKLKEFKK